MRVAFRDALEGRDEITITVTGRRSGRAISLPVWFAIQRNRLRLLPVWGSRTQWYRNLLVDPTITVRAGRRRVTVQATAIRDRKTVRSVVGQFRRKYTAGEIAAYYTRLDVAVEVPLPRVTR